MREILEMIWDLPWYKVLVIAVVDDAILFLKIWWLYCIIFLAIAIIYIMDYIKGKRG